LDRSGSHLDLENAPPKLSFWDFDIANEEIVKGEWTLDNSLQSKIVAMAFAMAAEIERDLISQRTKEALRSKKVAGVRLGRPRGPGKSQLDIFRPEIEALSANESTQKFIARRYHTTAANLHN